MISFFTIQFKKLTKYFSFLFCPVLRYSFYYLNAKHKLLVVYRKKNETDPSVYLKKNCFYILLNAI